MYHGRRGDPRKSREVHRMGGLRGVSSPERNRRVRRRKMSAEVSNCISCMEALGIGCFWSGLCVWLDDEAQRYAGELYAMGAHWSIKRGAFYFRFGGTR